MDVGPSRAAARLDGLVLGRVIRVKGAGEATADSGSLWLALGALLCVPDVVSGAGAGATVFHPAVVVVPRPLPRPLHRL